MIQPFIRIRGHRDSFLRVILGIILIAHGWPKIKTSKERRSGWDRYLSRESFGAAVVSILEFVGGIFLLAGFLVQLVAVLIAIQFAVIILKMKMKKGLADGYEFDLIIFMPWQSRLRFSAAELTVWRISSVSSYTK